MPNFRFINYSVFNVNVGLKVLKKTKISYFNYVVVYLQVTVQEHFFSYIYKSLTHKKHTFHAKNIGISYVKGIQVAVTNYLHSTMSKYVNSVYWGYCYNIPTEKQYPTTCHLQCTDSYPSCTEYNDRIYSFDTKYPGIILSDN